MCPINGKYGKVSNKVVQMCHKCVANRSNALPNRSKQKLTPIHTYTSNLEMEPNISTLEDILPESLSLRRTHVNLNQKIIFDIILAIFNFCDTIFHQRVEVFRKTRLI